MRFLIGVLMLAPVVFGAAENKVTVVSSPGASPRELLAAERVKEALKSLKAPVPAGAKVVLSVHPSPSLPQTKAEAFHIYRNGNEWIVTGSDASGVLYGGLELARVIRVTGSMPTNIDISDAPKFVLRGPSVGMQKTEITYDGAMYDYRYTPGDFPFFYDKARWTKHLDFLLENRMNTLYLWNGHPFTSLLKLPKYPDAQELSDAQLEQNMAMFKWLTAEADKRGIWVVQFFYNIHISHALARSRGVAFQHQTPTPLTSEYTRYCISEFIRSYPNVGLLMTLGEALAPRYGPEWLTKTVIPGVKDGMKALGTDKEPPIIVRAHATDIDNAMKQALPLYKNIYTMHKWNGESLTWTDVRGGVLKVHESLVKLGSTHISNVHLLSNLEPWRWGSPDFIQKTMQSSERIGIRGLHLYPLRYWDWPNSADQASPMVEQLDRDWIWFEAWARYAWNPDRERGAEKEYWINRIAEKYGTRAAGAKILEAYESSGICAPKLLPRIGITEGNRQSLTLGMLMTQLINPARYNELTLLWTGDAPEGERLNDWVKKEWEKQPHVGETPIGVVDEVVQAAEAAVAAGEAARPHVTRNREEFERLQSDLRGIAIQMRYYQAKTKAAALVMRYGYSRDLKDLLAAKPLLEKSLLEYRQLVALTEKTYRQACSVHSVSRRIPFLGGPGRYTHWRDCLPEYEKEYERFLRNLEMLSSGKTATAHEETRAAYPGVGVKLLEGEAEMFAVKPGEKLYIDGTHTIADMAPELRGLTGIRVSSAAAAKDGVKIEFELAEPAQVLVGFFRSSKKGVAAAPPKDEWEPILRNGIAAGDHPGLTIYSHHLPAGKNGLDFGRGSFVVLGFIKKDAQPEPRMVFFGNAGVQARVDLDWLFE